jgi:hypothetical protein
MQNMKKTRAWVAVGALVAALVFLSLASCATTGSGSGSSQTLNWRQVDPSAFGSRQFNTMGLQTFGPNTRQLYGYVLYPDGVTVSVSGRITGSPLGKMSLADVLQDYQRVLRENMITTGGNLILREITRNGSVVAYTATQPWMNVTTWDMAPGTPGPVVLQVTFP